MRLYRRDRFTCVYCNESHPREKLTIDHVRTRSNGGHNHHRNLVTACRSCNSSRQDKELEAWCAKRGFDFAVVSRRIHNAIRRKLPVARKG